MFITYAHESSEHKNATLQLAGLLVDNGVDTQLDQWAEGTRIDWSAWAIKEITTADFVLVIASPAYKAVGDGFNAGDVNLGVQAETAVLRDLLHKDRAAWLPKLLPVVLPGRAISDIPYFMQPNVADHYLIDEVSQAGIDSLLRVITNQPRGVRPPLGKVPYLPPHSIPEPEGRVTPSGPMALPAVPEVQWRAVAVGWSEVPSVEVHLVPVGVQPRIQVRDMEPLANQLANLGRQHELFGMGAELDIRSNDQLAKVSLKGYGVQDGLEVLRAGQRSAVFALPKARLGRVLIPEVVAARAAAMIRLLLQADVPVADAYAPAIGLAPLDLTRVGTQADLTANSAQAPLTLGEKAVRFPPEEAYPCALLVADAQNVAEELTARLVAAFRRISH
ncbi:SEFIR domain-containing protein [Actinokineospora globicatena]|uniref:SEFIR domain-containing protein n=1 Tax=Actinokineospora globicatena TaxID=103729 RepID=UPI00255543D2|nr:SEFIR domain-containing protein [Actinokineospora globicatena]